MSLSYQNTHPAISSYYPHVIIHYGWTLPCYRTKTRWEDDRPSSHSTQLQVLHPNTLHLLVLTRLSLYTRSRRGSNAGALPSSATNRRVVGLLCLSSRAHRLSSGSSLALG